MLSITQNVIVDVAVLYFRFVCFESKEETGERRNIVKVKVKKEEEMRE